MIALFEAYAQRGDAGGDRACSQRMQLAGAQPDLMTYSSVVNVYAHTGDAKGRNRRSEDAAG